MESKIETLLILRKGGAGSVGKKRIKMLEAVAEFGGVSGAARALGLSYKAVWDGIGAINNLAPRPVLRTKTGGRNGGGASLTEDGRRLIATFRGLEKKLSIVSDCLSGGDFNDNVDILFWSVAMKTSARNVFRCQVTALKRAPVNVEVVMKLSDDNEIVAVITNDSVEEMGIVPGCEVVALIKSSFVMLGRGDKTPSISARNLLKGTVLRRIDGGVNSEIVLDLGGGKNLTSVITRESADSLPLKEGDPAYALFKASHVILAVE